MQWWNDIVTWIDSTRGTRVITTAIIPFVAIVIAGVLAALIARSSARRVIRHQDREIKAAAIMALIGAGRRAAVWSTLGNDEKRHVDALISEADLRMRLLPVSGAIAAADWANHELGAMKKNSSNFSFQAEQTFFDYRDRLLDWQLKPAKAKKLFAFDLVRWQYEDGNTSQSSMVLQQQEWSSGAPNTSPAPPAPSAATVPPPATPPVPESRVGPSAVGPSAVESSAFESSTVEPSPAGSSAAEPNTIESPVVEATIEEPDADESIPERTGDDADGHNATLVIPALSDDEAAASSTDSPTSTDSRVDDEAVDELDHPFAPPVNAGAVRARTAPDRSLETD